MTPVSDVLARLEGSLIVSCQAPEGHPFRDPASMARFARCAIDGGAAGIRANGAEDIAAIRAVVDAPIIGIDKQLMPDGRILITPSFEGAQAVVRAGASIVALDCTARGRRHRALDRVRRIRAELGIAVMADIATVEEAVAAAEAGADLVASTMRGYTDETAAVDRFQPAFIAELARAVNVPVLAEGRIGTPAEAAAAIRAGAFAVIVGTAITRPEYVTRPFVQAVARQKPAAMLGIDLGGTRTKFGVVSAGGQLLARGSTETPAHAGREALLENLRTAARRAAALAREAAVECAALGIATAGWVDTRTGRVAYATENLPGWTGTPIAEELRAATGLPVAVENDANALAVAERHFGLARGIDDFVCVTLGTGVGGGCYVGGRLNRGAHYFANALGHIPIELDGTACTCGRRGCLEQYANAAALLRFAGGAYASAEAVIAAANKGDERASGAIGTLARYLGAGLATLVQLLDPRLVVVAGGLAQDNPFLVPALERELAARVPVWELRGVRIAISELGYYAGVLGAAGSAREVLAGEALA